MRLQERHYENGGVTIIAEGRIDSVTAPEFERFTTENIVEAQSLIFDFNDLEYISSAGLRVLISAQKAMNKKGLMKIIGCNETILHIFSVAGLLNVFTIV